MKSYAVDVIRDEMMADGSHWWDKSSMRYFGTRVGDQVYQGEGGVFFVTSEKSPYGPRAYSVRQYKPETKEIDTVGGFNSLTRSQAHREAAKLAGPAAVVTKAAYTPKSEAEQLAHDISRGGGRASATSAAWLIRLATRYDKMMVDYCNGDFEAYDQDGELTPKHKELREAIEAAAKEHNCGAILGGDPRGCVFKLILPNGETNDFGKEGWCVPTKGGN